MKLALVADVHLANHRKFGGELKAGINTRCRAISRALRCAVDEARLAGAPLVVLGDLFDSSKPTPQEVFEAMGVLRAAAGTSRRLEFGYEAVEILAGNHDICSEQWGDNALMPLSSVDGVCLNFDPIIGTGDVLCCPYKQGSADEWLPALLADREEVSVLLLHLGIADERTPSYMRNSPDSIDIKLLWSLMEKHGITHCYAGNWHTHQIWEKPIGGVRRYIVQVGALAPTGFDNPGSGYGKVVIHEGDLPPRVITVPGPRFYRAVFEDLDDETLEDTMSRNDTNYLSLRARPKHLGMARAKIKELIAAGLLTDGEVLPDREATRATLVSAARGARSAQSVDEAVAAFVAKTAMPEGADRKQVLAIVQRYLAGG